MAIDMKNYTPVILGVGAAPVPTYDPQTGVSAALANEQGAIAFYTRRQERSRSGALTPTSPEDAVSVQDQVYGELMRNLPTRGMLPHLQRELVERDPDLVDWDRRSMVAGYMGPPSIGKSFMIKTLDKLAHPRGCLYLNCKDVDMGVLFCETVFDTSAADREKAAIDARLLQGNQGGKGLSDDSHTALRQALGEAYVSEQVGDRTLVSIDWNGIAVKGQTQVQQDYQKQVVREALRQVCQAEGIGMSAEAGQIGITTRDGIAVRAADPQSADFGRPILLDEVNRCKAGTLQKLYEYFALLSDPKVDKLEVIAGQNRPVTLDRQTLPASYRVNFTGNPATRGMGSATMDKPLVSRFGVELDVVTVPDPALHDYADRIAQYLTGVPLMQIYESARETFDANPALLTQVARHVRTVGLTDAQKRNIPAEELLNIDNAPKIMNMAAQLGRFFDGLKPILNPDSALHMKGGTAISSEYEDYLRGLEVDLRLVSKLIEKATLVPPKATTSVDYAALLSGEVPKARSAPTLEGRLEDRGDRLEAYVQQWLHNVLVPKDAGTRGIEAKECKTLYALALKHAADCGLGLPELKEVGKGEVVPIKELYNVDSLSQGPEKIRIVRDLMVDMVRQNYQAAMQEQGDAPALPSDPEQILPLADVILALKQQETLQPGTTQTLWMPATSVADLADAPFVVADTGTRLAENSVSVTRDAFLLALAVPELQAPVLASLWQLPDMVSAQGLDVSDPVTRIAMVVPEPGQYGVTSVTFAPPTGGTVPEDVVHIFRAVEPSGMEKLMVVTGAVTPKLQKLLKSNGITYINAQDSDAAQKIDQQVAASLPAKTIKERDALSAEVADALLLRYEPVENPPSGLGARMVDQTLALAMPVTVGVPQRNGRG